MKKNTSINGLCFDDILLVPHDKSPISTRASIRLETKLGNPNNPEAVLTLHSPIISAPMESISTSAMLHGLQSLGCIGMTERSKSIDEKIFKNLFPMMFFTYVDSRGKTKRITH